MNAERFLIILMSSGVLAACTTQPGSVLLEDDAPNIVAIGRYVLDTNRFSDLYDHVESFEPGGIKYDDEFIHPHLPLGGLVVDCQETHRIGVTFAVVKPPETKRIGAFDRYGSSWSGELKLRYRWSHSVADDIGRSYYVTPDPYGLGNVLSDGITLSKESRIDGVWTVAVTHNDEKIYQTDFQLVGCPASNSD